jgi:glutamine cyclotransferase
MRITSKKVIRILIASVFVLVYSCGLEKQKESTKEEVKVTSKTVPIILYSVKKKYPHDTTAFTEGLLFHDNKLFESTGDVEYLPQTRSTFGIADLGKGKIDVKAELDKNAYFGEGIVVLNDKIYQLTYTTQVGFIYDSKTFRKIGQFNYPNKEGWGLTTDGSSIIMSDGTFNLTYLDPKDFKVTRTLAVTENGYALDHINELEYINGFIYANIWLTTYIVKIDPSSGDVVGKADLSDLYTEAKSVKPSCLEMNGIAYDSISNRILVTGKLWPYIYEIDFKH